MRQTTSYLLATAILAVAATLMACSQTEPEPTAGPRAENSILGIAVAIVPAPFAVVSNDGPVMEFRAPGEAQEAILTIEAAGEAVGGVNLVAEAEEMRDWFEQQPEGQFFGNLELGTPLGPAFTSRGSYLLNGVAVEEIRVFSLHPSANRMLRWTYRYAPGEGKERLVQLAEVLGEIEALAEPDQEAGSGESTS